MNTPKLDVDSLIEALRDDVPSEREEARVRARLVATGVLAATALTSSQVAANSMMVVAGTAGGSAVSAASATGTSAATAAGAAAVGGAGASMAPLGTLPVGAAQVGLWSKVIALPLATKIGIAGTVAVGVAAGSAPVLSDAAFSDTDRAVVTGVERAPERGASPRALAAARQEPAATVQSAAPSAQLPVSPPAISAAAAAAAPAPARVESSRSAPARAESEAARPEPARAERLAAPSAAARATPAPARAASATLAEPAAVQGDETSAPASEGVRSSAAAPNAYASASTLAEETGLMERAISALHDGDLERARHWLGEHERRFPNGLLARERYRALARVEQRAR